MSNNMYKQKDDIKNTPINSSKSHQAERSTIVQEKIEWIRDFASKNINSLLIDERRCIPPHILIELGNQGLLGMHIEKKFDGLALTLKESIQIVEQLAAVDTTLAIFVGLNNALGIIPINKFGSEKMRKEILPNLAKGLELGAFALTEAGAGSNPRNMTTMAKPDGKGGWIINGEKVWIGSGAWATYLNVFVNVVDEEGKLLGITAFLVRKDTPGVIVGEEAMTMGVKGMVQNKIYLKDVHVTKDDMIGEIGKGFEIAQETMKIGRLGLCSVCLGAMKRCFTIACQYAQNRKIITGRLIENPVTLDILKKQKMRIEILETLLYNAVHKYDNKEPIAEEIYITAKIMGPEFLWETVDETMQILGGRGYVETNVIPQIMRDARLLRIFEGPTETMTFYLGLLLSQKNSQFINKQLDYADLSDNIKKAQQIIVKRPKNLIKNRYNLGILGSFIIVKSIMLEEDVISTDILRWLDKQIEAKMKDIVEEPEEETQDPLSEIMTQNNIYLEELGYNKGTAPGIDTKIDDYIKRRKE